MFAPLKESFEVNRKYAAGMIFYEAEERCIIFPSLFNLRQKRVASYSANPISFPTSISIHARIMLIP